MSKNLTGGCLCGAIRYEVTGKPFGVFHCHCSLCRRAGASAFVTWIGASTDKGGITQGDVKIFASSEDGRRGFCPTCGAQISFAFESDPEHVYFTAATLDDPNMVTPESHGYTSDSVRWLHIDDDLPIHDKNPPAIDQVLE